MWLNRAEVRQLCFGVENYGEMLTTHLITLNVVLVQEVIVVAVLLVVVLLFIKYCNTLIVVLLSRMLLLTRTCLLSNFNSSGSTPYLKFKKIESKTTKKRKEDNQFVDLCCKWFPEILLKNQLNSIFQVFILGHNRRIICLPDSN